jgi:hypothetical protein
MLFVLLTAAAIGKSINKLVHIDLVRKSGAEGARETTLFHCEQQWIPPTGTVIRIILLFVMVCLMRCGNTERSQGESVAIAGLIAKKRGLRLSPFSAKDTAASLTRNLDVSRCSPQTKKPCS